MPTFSRPANGSNRGIHWSASCDHSHALANWPFWKDELAKMGVKWVKLLDSGGGSSIQMCQALLSADIIPIVRLYRPRPNPGTLHVASLVPPNPEQMTAQNAQTIGNLVNVGVRYFEANNEPNLRDEWNYADWQSYPWQRRVQMVCDGWIKDAVKIISLGGLPAFPALAQCGHTMNDGAIGSIPFYIEAVRYLAERYPVAAPDILKSGAWLAVHNYGWNHPAAYPYDPINQADHPGETVFQDDSTIRSYEVPQDLFFETFGVDLPIICTEGGYVPPANGWEQKDTRYPALTYDSQARLTVAAYSWLAENAPQVWAMCPWLIANERMGHNDTAWTGSVWYYDGGERPVVQAMKEATVPEPEFIPLDAIRNAAWNAAGQPYNPDAAFPKYAREHSLGVPLTGEFDVNGYRVQGFAGGIVYCLIGDWGNVKDMPW